MQRSNDLPSAPDSFTRPESSLVAHLGSTGPEKSIVRRLVFIESEYGPSAARALRTLQNAEEDLAVFSTHYCMDLARSSLQSVSPENSERSPVLWHHLKDVVPDDAFDNVVPSAFNIIRGWYRSDALVDERGSMTYVGVPLGGLVEFELSSPVIRLLTKVKMVLELLKTVKPLEIVVVTSDMELAGVARFVAANLNVAVQVFHTSVSTPPLHLGSKLKRVVETAAGALLDVVAHCIFLTRNLLRLREGGQSIILIESISRLFPLADAIEQRGSYRPVVIGFGGYLRRWAEALRGNRLFQPFSYWLNPKALMVSLQARWKTKLLWVRLERNEHWRREVFTWNELDIWEVLAPVFQEIVERLFPRRVGQLIATSTLLKAYKPRAVVLDNDMTAFQVMLCKLCEQMNVPTIEVHHGTHYGILSGLPPKDIINSEIVATWGTVHTEYYATKGIDKGRIVPVGSSLLDVLFERLGNVNRVTVIKELVCNKLALDSTKKIVTFATTYTGTDEFANPYASEEETATGILDGILCALRPRPGWQLIVKLHPLEKPHKYVNVLNRFPECQGRVTIVESYPLHDIIDASEFLIMLDSTVGLEAIVLGTPVIFVKTGNPWQSPYTKHRVVLPVYELGTIVGAVGRMMDNPDEWETVVAQRGQFLRGCGYLLDGCSLDRLVALVEQTATHGRTW